MKAIVILGTKIFFNKSLGRYYPSEMLKLRLDKAHEVYVSNYNDQTIFVVSGGKPPKEYVTESSVMRQYLQEKGVPSCKIFEETKSRNTVENCIFTYELLSSLYNNRLTFQELIPNYQCNYYGTNLYGEIPPFKEICVVTSDFHIPRSRIIFETFNSSNCELSFVKSSTPHSVAEAYCQNEQKIDIKRMINPYIIKIRNM